jgi:hypothetical protein
MSDSLPDEPFDEPRLPDELDEGAQQAGNSDSGQFPLFLPHCISSSPTIDKARPIPFLVLTLSLFFI